MAFFPASTNPDYQGSLFSAGLLGAAAVLTIVPGCIHSFFPDGGAGVIAGLDLTQCGPTIIKLFAWAGATQIVFGMVMLLTALRYRSFVPLLLTLLLLERTLHAIPAWVLNVAPAHRPPGNYALLVTLPLVALALRFSLRRSRPA